MRSFHFRGTIPASKSILNRLLILQAHSSGLTVEGDSNCEDVQDLKASLASLSLTGLADVGHGGTTLRFLAACAARRKGRFVLKASPRLLERPQAELIEILFQLGVKTEIGQGAFTIEGRGWKRPNWPLRLPLDRSSQFASAILLNAWRLPFELELQLVGDPVSQGYFDMTVKLVEAAGMKIRRSGSRWILPANQKIQVAGLTADADVSSAFSIAALAALGGSAEITNFPFATTLSPQPDRVFVSILEKMGARCEIAAGQLTVGAAPLRGIDVDLKNSPDLFPVLATLCGFAEGRSVLRGAPQLAFKESARIAKTAELLRLLGREVKERDDGLEVIGRIETSSAQFDFNPDQDHRLAMAAGVAMVAGADVRVSTPDVVKKSYPEYWQILQAGMR